MALLGAILAVALLTVVVLEATDVVVIQTRFARNAGNAVAAQLLARSAEIGAESLLLEDARGANAPSNTSPDGLWATPFDGIATETGGTVGFAIADEQGKIDLNVLASRSGGGGGGGGGGSGGGGSGSGSVADAEKLIAGVFSELGLDPGLVSTLRKWVSGAPDALAAGGEADYCLLPVPCAPSHVPLPALEELRVIRGFDARTVAQLRSYFTAIPGRAGGKVLVNVNTAAPGLLRALKCTEPDEARPRGGWTAADVPKFGCPVASAGRSEYFRILARGTMGDTTQTVLTVVQRSASGIKRHWWQENPVLSAPPSEPGTP